MSAKRGWMSLTLLLGAVLGFGWTGGTAAPAKKAKPKAVAGENVYYEPRAIGPSGYVNGKPIDIVEEIDRLVKAKFPKKKYSRGASHLHPWRESWDEFLGALDAHRQTSAFVLQSDSFLDVVTRTKSLCSDSSFGKLKSSEPTWVLAYFGYASGSLPVRLKSVTVSGRQIRIEYSRSRLDDPWIKQQGIGFGFVMGLGGDAVVIVNCGKLKPGDYEIQLVETDSRKPELTRTFSVAK